MGVDKVSRSDADDIISVIVVMDHRMTTEA